MNRTGPQWQVGVRDLHRVKIFSHIDEFSKSLLYLFFSAQVPSLDLTLRWQIITACWPVWHAVIKLVYITFFVDTSTPLMHCDPRWTGLLMFLPLSPPTRSRQSSSSSTLENTSSTSATIQIERSRRVNLTGKKLGGFFCRPLGLKGRAGFLVRGCPCRDWYPRPLKASVVHRFIDDHGRCWSWKSWCDRSPRSDSLPRRHAQICVPVCCPLISRTWRIEFHIV